MIDLQPLWAEPFPVAPHAVLAILALVLGAAQLVLPKGTLGHRFVGYVWVGLMAGVAVSGLFIHGIKLWGLFSPIHLLIPVTLYLVYHGVLAARRGDIKRHRIKMLSLFFLALVVTGAFTLLPGRIMHQVLFGG